MTFNAKDALAFAGDIPRGFVDLIRQGAEQRRRAKAVDTSREALEEALKDFENVTVTFVPEGDEEYILPEGFVWADDDEDT